MAYLNRVRNLTVLGSLLLISTNAYTLDGPLDLNTVPNSSEYITTNKNYTNIDIGNGGVLRVAPNVAVTFHGVMNFNSTGRIIFELGQTAADIGTIAAVGFPINIQTGATVETVVNDVPPSGSFPVTYTALNGVIALPGGNVNAVTFVADPNSQASLVYDDLTGPSYYLNIVMTGYSTGTTQISTNSTIVNQTTQQNSDTYNGNIVQKIGTEYCTETEVHSFALASRTLGSAQSMLSHFLSKKVWMVPTKHHKMAGMEGLIEPRADISTLVKDGQLPTMEFRNPILGARVWVQGIYNHYKNTAHNTHLASNSSGAQMGVDTVIPFPIGVSFSYITTTSKANRVNSGHIKSYQAGLYGAYLASPMYYIGNLSYSHSHNKMGTTIKSNYSTKGFNAFILAGYTYKLPHDNVLEPLVSLNYGRNWIPSIKEYNGAALFSTSRAQALNSFQSELGARFSHFFNTHKDDTTPIKVYAQATWGHTFSNRQQASNIVYANGSGSTVNIPGQRQTRDKVNLGAGMSAQLNDVNFYVSYANSLAAYSTSHTAVIGFRAYL